MIDDIEGLTKINASVVPEELNLKFIKKYYTDDGYKALKDRFDALLKLSLDKETKFPYKRNMLGFPILYIQSREELLFKIKELCEIMFITNLHVEEQNVK